MDRQDEADRRVIKPLEGIRVVNLSRVLAGLYCTALLADMGAKIIKVESLNGSDIARRWPPPLLGEHTAEILRDIGNSDDDIERLDKNGRLRIDKETA